MPTEVTLLRENEGLPALVSGGEVVDADAVEIGELYEQGNSEVVGGVLKHLECGEILSRKKATMKHGKWLVYLDENERVLGFGISTAQRLIKANKAKTALARHLDEDEILKLGRQMWGHDVHVAANSGENEWYTPPDILDRARAVLGGFDLDPASSLKANEMVQAEQIFTAADDGLSREWPVGRIWMNPPYAQPLIGQFSERFANEIKRGSTGIALVNNATETEWFQTLSVFGGAICFPRGRVKFLDENGDPGAPLQGQAIIYCGPLVDEFRDEFSDLGFIVRVSR